MTVKKTVEIDDNLVSKIREIQKNEGKTFKQIINEKLLKGLQILGKESEIKANQNEEVK